MPFWPKRSPVGSGFALVLASDFPSHFLWKGTCRAVFGREGVSLPKTPLGSRQSSQGWGTVLRLCFFVVFPSITVVPSWPTSIARSWPLRPEACARVFPRGYAVVASTCLPVWLTGRDVRSAEHPKSSSAWSHQENGKTLGRMNSPGDEASFVLRNTSRLRKPRLHSRLLLQRRKEWITGNGPHRTASCGYG